MPIFPCLYPRGALEKEKEHVEGFAPEVAGYTKWQFGITRTSGYSSNFGNNHVSWYDLR